MEYPKGSPYKLISVKKIQNEFALAVYEDIIEAFKRKIICWKDIKFNKQGPTESS